MIVTRAEILTWLGLANETAISKQSFAMITMAHQLGEAAIKSFLQTELEYAQRVELLPSGEGSRYGIGEESLDVNLVGGDRVQLDEVRANRSALVLRHTPVFLTGLTVKEDLDARGSQGSGAFGSGTALTLGTDFWLDITEGEDLTGSGGSDTRISHTGILYRTSGNWPNTPRTVQVKYYGGMKDTTFTTMLGVVRLATLHAIEHIYRAATGRQTNNIAAPALSERIGKYSISTSAELILQSVGGAGAILPDTAKHLLAPYRSYRYR